jgi:hypothetical protein
MSLQKSACVGKAAKIGCRKAAGSSNTKAYIVQYVEGDERRERSDDPFSATN